MKLELDLPDVDFKEEIRYKSCLNYVIKNFNELEPIIREYWIKNTSDKFTDLDLDAIQGLLDLYNKQKEEIETLKEVDKKICNEELLEKDYVLKNYINKDKIRDKIKEIHNYTFMSLEERDQQDYAMTKLEELLGE